MTKKEKLDFILAYGWKQHPFACIIPYQEPKLFNHPRYFKEQKQLGKYVESGYENDDTWFEVSIEEAYNITVSWLTKDQIKDILK